MEFPKSFFEDEVRDGFFVPAMMKRAWAAEMQILEDIDKVCKKHNIKYFVDWGTLLGAVRHGGFIPWDDDIDISMLREDYEKFAKVAPEEMKERYTVYNYKNPGREFEEQRFMTYVTNKVHDYIDNKFLEYFHGYCYHAGIDIFPLDYMAPTKKEDEVQLMQLRLLAKIAEELDSYSEKEKEDYLKEIEKMYHTKFDAKTSTELQLYLLMDKICASYGNKDSSYVTNMISHTKKGKLKFSEKCFEDTVLIPFENMLVPAPAQYEEVLKIEYGNYQKCIHNTSTHQYPVYGKQEKWFEEENGKSLIISYCFKEEDLHREDCDSHSLKRITAEMLKILHKAYASAADAVNQGNMEMAAALLEQCQDGAIALGTEIEKIKHEGFITVNLLEKYCEDLYYLHETVLGYMDANIKECQAKLQESFDAVEKSAQKDILQRKEAVFLPYKASAWNSMEAIYNILKENPDYDIQIVPIPYYYREFNGEFGEMCFEINDYPDDLILEDYQTFDFGLHHPDLIIIHNPYDSYNITTSVPPFFYSDNLMKFTNQLIYTPYFYTDEIDLAEYDSVYNMKYYCTMPGVVRADAVIVQSESMRKLYINKLVEFAGEETREVWEKKIWAKVPLWLKSNNN